MFERISLFLPRKFLMITTKMKIKTWILIGMSALLFLSTATEDASLTEGYQPGYYAPKIALPENNQTIEFTAQSGHYTLVNFWAAYDAVSRVRNVQLWNRMNELDSTCITLYSVSLDERVSVYEETLKTDQLEKTNQLHDIQGLKSSLYKKYRLNKGFRNFLIDDKGVIIAIAVTPDQLSGFEKKDE